MLKTIHKRKSFGGDSQFQVLESVIIMAGRMARGRHGSAVAAESRDPDSQVPGREAAGWEWCGLLNPHLLSPGSNLLALCRRGSCEGHQGLVLYRSDSVKPEKQTPEQGNRVNTSPEFIPQLCVARQL